MEEDSAEGEKNRSAFYQAVLEKKYFIREEAGDLYFKLPIAYQYTPVGNYENLIDDIFPNLAFNEKIQPTIKGATLHDILVIRNWIYFAKLNGDEKVEMISAQLFESNYIKKNISLKYS